MNYNIDGKSENKNVGCVVHSNDDEAGIKSERENRLIKSRTSMAIAGNSGSKIPLLNFGSQAIRCTSWAGSDLTKAYTQLRMQCQQQNQNHSNNTSDNDTNLIKNNNNNNDCEQNNNTSNINYQHTNNNYNNNKKRNIVHVDTDVDTVSNDPIPIRKTNAFQRSNLMRLTPGLCLVLFLLV